jgi:hypothetical protein
MSNFVRMSVEGAEFFHADKARHDDKNDRFSKFWERS